MSIWTTLEERRWFVEELSTCGFSADEVAHNLSVNVQVVHADRRSIPDLLNTMKAIPHRKSKRRIAPLILQRLDEWNQRDPDTLEDREKQVILFLEEWIEKLVVDSLKLESLEKTLKRSTKSEKAQ